MSKQSQKIEGKSAKSSNAGKVTGRLPYVIALLVIVLGAVVVFFLRPSKPVQPADRQEDLSSLYSSLAAEQLRPFTRSDISRIKENRHHSSHIAAGNCATCHETSAPMSQVEVATLCIDCHESSVSYQPVWSSHCTSCHYFAGDRWVEEAGPPDKELCLACHDEKEAGPYIYGFYSHEVKSKIACRSCHQPHSTADVSATDRCTNCHGIYADSGFLKPGHKDCASCHSPHDWVFDDGERECAACHEAPRSILAHAIGAHPDKCTECHNPHFIDKDTNGGQCDECHADKPYIAGRNIPQEHRQCTSCHSPETWRFKGIQTCTGCHPGPGAAGLNPAIPADHKDCGSCHKEHRWYASFETTCSSCHDPKSVLEHRIEFHPDDCRICHDPHLGTLPPASGDCAACHGAGAIPRFTADAPPPHVACDSCHSKESVDDRGFEFMGSAKTCKLCHALAAEQPAEISWEDAPSGHTLCVGCHQAHTWEAEFGEDTCGLCHSATLASVAAAGMADCRFCHVSDHLMEFAGYDNSCAFCHEVQAAEAAQIGKNDCGICHLAHDFQAEPDSCSTCHGVPPGAHDVAGHQICLNCHQLHSFKVNIDACTLCHSDREEHFAGTDCVDCHLFRE